MASVLESGTIGANIATSAGAMLVYIVLGGADFTEWVTVMTSSGVKQGWDDDIERQDVLWKPE